MGFSTNYEDVNGDFGIIPEGDYEVVIRNIEERTTSSRTVIFSIRCGRGKSRHRQICRFRATASSRS